MARGVSAKYPTSGSRVVIDDLLASKSESKSLEPIRMAKLTTNEFVRSLANAWGFYDESSRSRGRTANPEKGSQIYRKEAEEIDGFLLYLIPFLRHFGCAVLSTPATCCVLLSQLRSNEILEAFLTFQKRERAEQQELPKGAESESRYFGNCGGLRCLAYTDRLVLPRKNV